MTFRDTKHLLLDVELGHVDSSRWCLIGSNDLGVRLVIAKRDTEAEVVARRDSLHANRQYHAMSVVAPTTSGKMP